MNSEGDFSGAVDAMRLCVASSPTYKTLTASDSETQSLGTVVFAGEYEDTVVSDARCIVRQAQGLTLNGDGSGGAFSGRIAFLVLFELPIPEAYWNKFSDEIKWVSNQCGPILFEMLQNCRKRPDEMPDIRAVDDTLQLGVYDPDEHQGKHIGVYEYRIEAVLEMVV